MVNIIENKAEIQGKINAIHKNTGPPGYCQIEVELQKSNDVEDYPNLAKADESTLIIINVRPEQLSDDNIQIGNSLCAIVHKVFGQQYYMDSGI